MFITFFDCYLNYFNFFWMLEPLNSFHLTKKTEIIQGFLFTKTLFSVTEDRLLGKILLLLFLLLSDLKYKNRTKLNTLKTKIFTLN